MNLVDIIPVTRSILQDTNEGSYQYNDTDIQKLISINFILLNTLNGSSWVLDTAIPTSAESVTPDPTGADMILVSWFVWVDLYPTLNESGKLSGLGYTSTMAQWAQKQNPLEIKRDILNQWKLGELSSIGWDIPLVDTQGVTDNLNRTSVYNQKLADRGYPI